MGLLQPETPLWSALNSGDRNFGGLGVHPQKGASPVELTTFCSTESLSQGDFEQRNVCTLPLVSRSVTPSRYYALMVRDYNAPRLDSVTPMARTQADGACEEINGCSRRMMMHR